MLLWYYIQNAHEYKFLFCEILFVYFSFDFGVLFQCISVFILWFSAASMKFIIILS